MTVKDGHVFKERQRFGNWWSECFVFLVFTGLIFPPRPLRAQSYTGNPTPLNQNAFNIAGRNSMPSVVTYALRLLNSS